PDNFERDETPVENPGSGQMLVRNIYLSVDPAMKGWISVASNYSQPVGIGEVMRSVAVGQVMKSNLGNYESGDYVLGLFGWQEYAQSDGSDVWWKVDAAQAPIATSLGVLGLNGLSAYFGLMDIGQPKNGETVVVSTGAGAVGSIVGQIAKIHGCRTIAITGSDEKVEVCLDEFGYDAAINYKTADLVAELTAACPDGVHVYFDNTGGAISDAVFNQLAVGARIVICGTAATASWDPPPLGPRVERQILVNRALMQGFIIFDFANRYEEGRGKLAAWMKDGKIRYREDFREGLAAAPGALAEIYEGKNSGKMMVRVGEEQGD
ncbi:MAG: NADP-dependent oxidoreductase, partial [bacterium]